MILTAIKRRRLTAAVTWLSLCVAGTSARLNAQETVLELDPSQTRIEFTLAAVLHTVHGTFRLKRGTIRFDPATRKASGELVVDATTGNSGNEGRDRKMHADILESSRYPEIIFAPDRVEGALAGSGPLRVQLHGLFRIHGAEHELTLPVEARIGPAQFTATTRLAVPYVKWGMKNPSTFILRVSDRVDIDIRAAGRVGPAGGP